MNVAQETLGFRRQGLSPCLSLLMSAFALLIAPASLSRHLHSLRERSSTTPSNPLITLAFETRRAHGHFAGTSPCERQEGSRRYNASKVPGLHPRPLSGS